MNSRLLVRLQKKHGSQRCRVELVELTVDDVWQIADAGLATRNFRDWHAIIGEVTWSSVLKTTMDCHSKLVLHSLGINNIKYESRLFV